MRRREFADAPLMEALRAYMPLETVIIMSPRTIAPRIGATEASFAAITVGRVTYSDLSGDEDNKCPSFQKGSP